MLQTRVLKEPQLVCRCSFPSKSFSYEGGDLEIFGLCMLDSVLFHTFRGAMSIALIQQAFAITDSLSSQFTTTIGGTYASSEKP